MAAQVGADRKEGRERKMLFDPDDPEYIKDLQRPAAIKEDLTEMERRKRVQQILESKEFCRELEEVIRQESDSARSDPDHLRTLQRLSELTLPHGQLAAASLHGIGTSSLPIADLKGIDKYGKVEKILRQKLASLYRLVDLFQWSQGIYNHITVRLPGDEDEILINPFGLLYHEITASSLIKVALDGSVLDPGSTKLGINNAGYVLHSAIHAARPDVQCVIHMHTAVVSAVSSMKCGLLPLCQEAMIIGPVAYHDYQGILDDESEKQSIVTDLGDKNVMILRNHGFVACGQSVEDALHLAFHTIIACETQILILRGNGFLVCGSTVEEAAYLTRNLIASADHQIRAARAGIENLVIPDEAAVQKAYKTARQGGGGVNRSPGKSEKGPAIVWGIGELEWEAWMRVLDNAGFRTGHIYRQPHLRQKTVPTTTNGHSDVAVPPAATAVGMVDESDPESLTAHKLAILRREQEKARWLNSPNSYQKIEILESGTDRPKVITKWVQDATSPCSNGTPVKIVSPHQFSPFGQNPKEFKDKQKAIKENRRMGATSAGPQSQILDGVTYEDLGLIKPVNGDGDSITGPADKIVLIGTASKGIIDRQHQHNAQVYRQLYAPNPFSTETDDDIKKYMQEVESKSPRATSARGSTLERSSEIPDISIYSNGKEHRADSPGAEHENGSKHDTASLMQAAREHRLREESCHEENAPTSQDISGRYTVETTFGSTDSAPRSRLVLLDSSNSSSSELSSPNSHFSPHRQFGRTTSARNRQLSSDTTISTSDSELSSHPITEAKEEQSPAKSEKKKKKKGLLSFMKKNKDKKEKA